MCGHLLEAEQFDYLQSDLRNLQPLLIQHKLNLLDTQEFYSDQRFHLGHSRSPLFEFG